MKIFITGGKGQLGQALQQTLTAHQLTAVDLDELDITNFPAVQEALAYSQPDLVVNCAAYTDVDGCAKNPELAYRVNGLGPQNLALVCQKQGSALLQVSTNEVFAGDNPAGYEEWQPLSARNPYGRSKAAGEFAVRSVLPRHYIVRTAWLYSAGGRNFIHAILKRAQETGRVRVVTDEIGHPTWVNDLAQAIAQLITTEHYGTYHLVNEGFCSRWAFANEIIRLAGLEAVNEPILGREFQRASTPPPYGILHNTSGRALGLTLRPWQQALAEFMAQLAL